MIVVTGATGQLGTLVLEQLLERVPPSELRAAVRSPDKASRWADLGIEVVQADYDDPASLHEAFEGADKVLLISSSEVGKRVQQHKHVIDAATARGVTLFVYTSMLNADTTQSVLAQEHLPTEEAVRTSGMDFVILRNGWYLENYTEQLAQPLELGAFHGAADEGRISAAPRVDFATAAATVLTEDGHENRIYELAGEPFSLQELANTVSSAVGREIPYVNLPEDAYRQALIDAGIPDGMAHMMASNERAIAEGDLEAPRDDLVRLLRRPPTPMREVVEDAVADMERF